MTRLGVVAVRQFVFFTLLSCTSGNDAGWGTETRWRGEFGRGSDGQRDAGLKLTRDYVLLVRIHSISYLNFNV